MGTWYCVCFLLILLFVNLIEAQTTDTLENVAAPKTCKQSSIYLEANRGTNCYCAINGKTGTDYQVGDCVTNGNCIHTANSDTTPQWAVDLGQIYTIRKITIIGRGGQLHRMRNVAVSVDNTVVYTFPLTNPTSDTTDIGVSPSLGTLPVTGRHVTLSRTNTLSDRTIIDFGEYGSVLLNICEVQIWAFNPCNPNPCQNGGTCQTINDGNPDSYTCRCPPGYTGGACSTAFNPCNSNPCQNGGTCQTINDRNPYSYTCRCPSGYTGATCSTNIDGCSPNPCVHGRCTDLIDGFNCTCDEGYNGTTCNNDIDDCSPNLCVHGRCTDLIDGFNCTCDAGYNDTTCNNGIACTDTTLHAF